MIKLSSFFNKKKTFGSTFLKTFFLLSIFSVIPLVCMALYFSSMAERFWKSESYRFNQKSFLQYTSKIDNRLFSAFQSAEQLSDNSSFLSFITDPTFEEVQRNTLIMKSLADIKTADNGIDLVYLFSNFNKLVLTSDKNGYPYQDFFDKEALDCYIDGTYSPMMDRVYTPADGDPIEFITVYQNIPKKSSGSLGCLILNIEKSFLFSFPDEAAILQMSVYDSDGKCLFSQSSDISYQKEQEFQNQLYRSNGSFIYDTGNEELVILNTFSSVTGWTYIAAAPMPVFFNSYRAISQLLFKIAAVTLIILCLLSFLISYRLYLPLRNLVNTISGKDTISGKSLSGEYQLIHSAYKDILNKNTSMSAALENMKPAVKDDFFFSLLRGDSFTEGELEEKLSFIDEGFTTHGYGVVVFQIPDYEDYVSRFDENARNLHRYTLSQIVENKISQWQLPFAFLKANRSTWALILNIDFNEPLDGREALVKIIKELQEQLPLFPFLAIGTGQLYDSIIDAPYSYREGVDSLKYQYYSQTGEESVSQEQSASKPPDTKYMELLKQCIRAGSPEEAGLGWENIFKELSQQELSLEQIRSIGAAVTNSCFSILIEQRLSFQTDSSSASNDYYNALSEAKSPDDLSAIVKSMVKSAAAQVQSFNKAHSGKIAERLQEYINNHLQEDISLNDLADFCHLSPPYVSKLFKDTLNMGFVEYINTLRVSRAKKLLEETKMTVEQIGFQVGFNNVRSFMRTFKQYENTTPGQYRTSCRKTN